MKKWNILVILVVTILIPYGSSELSVGVDGTIGIDLIPVTPINYSTISTNYSTYAGDAHLFDGYSPSTLYSYYKSMFDSVYATISSLANYLPLTGGTLTGNLTADYFIGNGSLLTGISSPTPTLQSVTDVGATTTNDITLSKDGTANLNIDTRASSNNKFATLTFKDKNSLRYAWIFRQVTDDIYLYDYLNAKFVMRYDQSQADLLLGEGGNINVGIGTAPDEKLQVDGNIHINDNYKSLYGTGKDASETFTGTTRISNAEVGSPEYNWTNYGGYNFDNNITSDEYILGKNQVTQYHRNATIDTTLANTWVNVTWDLTIDEETTSGYLLADSNASIVIENTGIYRVQGCLHPKNNGLGNQEAKLYSRILINGVEAKCLQFANSKEFKTTGIDTMPFIGTIYAEAGQKVQLQYYVTSLNIDFEGDAVFDNGVASSLNLERISN